MSTKQQLEDAIAALPDSLSLEEAVERLYQAFKRNQMISQGAAAAKRPARRPGSAKGLLQLQPDFDAPLADFAEYQ
jgi:hypothetical protein